MGEMSLLSPIQMSELGRAAASSTRCERSTQVPAELTVAQWALESGWGSHQPGNNCFGIKAYEGCFGVQSLDTAEVLSGDRVFVKQDFAIFPSLDACFEKHANLFTTQEPYAHAWAQYKKTSDLQLFIRQIGAVYATAPTYVDTLLDIIAMPAVRGCITESRKTVMA